MKKVFCILRWALLVGFLALGVLLTAARRKLLGSEG